MQKELVSSNKKDTLIKQITTAILEKNNKLTTISGVVILIIIYLVNMKTINKLLIEFISNNNKELSAILLSLLRQLEIK